MDKNFNLQKQIRNLLAILLVVVISATVLIISGGNFGSQHSDWLTEGWHNLEEDEVKLFYLIVSAGEKVTVKVGSEHDVVLSCDGYSIDYGGGEDSETCVLTSGQHEIQIEEYNGIEVDVWVEVTQSSTTYEPEHYEESSRSETTNEEISFGGFIELDPQQRDYFSGYVTKSYFVIEVAEGSSYQFGVHGDAEGAIFDADGYIMEEFQESDFYLVLEEGKYFLAFTDRDDELWISFDSTYQVWDSSEEHTVQASSYYEIEVSVTETTIFAVESDGDARIEIYDGGGLAQTVDEYVSAEDESFILEPGVYTLRFTEWSGYEMNFIIKSRAEE